MAKYYKVLAGDMMSVCQNSSIVPWHSRLLYTVNEWVYPRIPGSALFIFGSYDDARRFFDTEAGAYIYECQVKNPRKYLVPIKSDCFTLEEYWTKITELKKKKKTLEEIAKNLRESALRYKICPNGTYICNAVKLTKRIV